MRGFCSEGQLFELLVNLDLDADESASGVLSIHVELEYGAVIFVSRCHYEQAPHFKEFLD